MPSLAVSRSITDARARPRLGSPLFAPLLALLALLSLVPREAGAQSALALTEDASPIERGALRLTVSTGWVRYDERFLESGLVRSLGAVLSSDSLGPRQLPNLSPVEGAFGTLANNPAQRLTLGKLEVLSDARIVTTPIALEYGITRRLSFGVLVPIVQTRATTNTRVNIRAAGDSGRTSNTGFVPVASRGTAATTNAAVATSLTSAATSITALLGRCQVSPSAAECDRVRGREAEAAATAKRAADFAAAVRTGYGTTEKTVVVAPLTGSELATQIEAQRVALAAQLATFTPGTTIGTLFNAPTEFSYADLQGRNGVPGLLQNDLGGGLDSIHTTQTVGLGDVELRAGLLLVDHTQQDSLPSRGVQFRLAVGGSLRFATSLVDSARNLVDIGTGEGAGAEFRSTLDLLAGHRFGGTIAGRYAKAFARTVQSGLVGYPEAGFPYPIFGMVSRTAGSVVAVNVTPRFFVGEWLAFEGQYAYDHTAAPTFENATPLPCSGCTPPPLSVLPGERTVQRLGLGVRYSTVDSYLRRRARYPIEVSFRHLETISGSTDSPKIFREQIQLRLFYRVLR